MIRRAGRVRKLLFVCGRHELQKDFLGQMRLPVIAEFRVSDQAKENDRDSGS
jgi:hypothetical protein